MDIAFEIVQIYYC